MQTPESSPSRSRKRYSPISDITRKSWNNFRSKLGSKPNGDSTQSKSDFRLISASVPNRRKSNPQLLFEDLPPEKSLKGPTVEEEPEQANHTSGSTDNFSESEEPGELAQLGAPFCETANSISTPDDTSDTTSQFSFERKPSCRYYKTSEPGTTQRDSDTWTSCSTLDSLRDELLDGYHEDPEDLGEAEEDLDVLAELIAEANLLPDDEDQRENVTCHRQPSTSMHRQLSQISREDSVVTFFDETRPKRTRSTMSASSTVWPIRE